MLLSAATPVSAGFLPPPINAIDGVDVLDPACVGDGLLRVSGHTDFNAVPFSGNYITAQATGSPIEKKQGVPFSLLPVFFWDINIAYTAPPAPGLGFDVTVKLWYDVPVFSDVVLDTQTVSVSCNVPPVA